MKQCSKTVTYVFLALLAALVGVISGSTFPGCKTLNTPTVAEVGHIVEDCTMPEVNDLAGHVLDDVASALVTQDYSGGIRSIVANLVSGVASAQLSRATENGWSAVKCATRELLKQSNVHLGYGGFDEATAARERLMRDNAQAWLEAH
jgi:hypothetical protein